MRQTDFKWLQLPDSTYTLVVSLETKLKTFPPIFKILRGGWGMEENTVSKQMSPVDLPRTNIRML